MRISDWSSDVCSPDLIFLPLDIDLGAMPHDAGSMSVDQILTLFVLAAVVAALIWDKVRADVVALTGAAVLLMTGVVRPFEVQSAFASPAIIALASLFVIAYALELAGLLDRAIASAVAMCRRLGTGGIWLQIGRSHV